MTPRRAAPTLGGMKTLMLVTVAALAATLLAVAVQAHGSASRVMHLTVTHTKISDVDVPPLITSKTSPESPGDEVIAVSTVPGGHRYLSCSVARSGPTVGTALYACQVTYTLPGGTITAAGVARLNGRVTAAITGGTGAYAGASGVLVSLPGRDTLTLR
jgi:hypothetical protein